jgi:hypothetical protein
MSTRDYFKEREYFLEHICFYYDDSRYEGSGVMTWNPTAGFHLAARVKRNKPLPPRKDIKVISFDPSSVIRMKLDDGLWAIAPKVKVSDLGLFSGRLLINLNRVIFIQAVERDTNLMLPDTVTRETRIGGWQPSHSFSLSGIHYEDNSGQKITGQLNDRKYLDISWSFPKSNWAKTHSLQFAEALRDAISIVAGEVIQLRYHEIYRGKRIYTDIRTGLQTSSLGIVLRLFDQDILDKDLIIQLAHFLACDKKESTICRRIFRQVAEAARQQTSQASELLLSTILEAALRSLYDQPFAPDQNKRTNTFNLEGSLKTFRERYMSNDVEIGRKWKKVISKVLEAQRRLRDRNAHPDWLSGQGGAYSTAEMEQAVNDMILLSRFYGIMILALAGFRELQPIFPTPFKNWSPLLTVERIGAGDK